MTVELFCLHGFLGAASDWNDSFRTAPGRAPQTVHAPDWLARFARTQTTWDELARQVNAWACEASPPAAGCESADRILIGYSLGGRVAMHALIANPRQWSGGVIVAANPGLQTNEARRLRAEHDREWAERFRRDPWPRVIGDWNAQPLFAGEAPPIERAESPAARETAAAALERLSVGNQRDLRQELRGIPVPMLWVAGERDGKYASLMRECAALNPRFSYAEIPGAGHRAPWTGAPYFEKVVRDWIDTVPTMASHEDAQPT